MDKLSLSISNSLRMRDVYTRYSRSQYLLLLLEADRDSFKKIEDRIMTKFRRSRTMDNIKIRFDFNELSAAPEAVPPRQNKLHYLRLFCYAKNQSTVPLFFLSAKSHARLSCSLINALTTLSCRYQLFAVIVSFQYVRRNRMGRVLTED